MSLASYLTPNDVTTQNLRISSAETTDVEFYDRAAYKRMNQLTNDAEGLLLFTLFPKASIELLNLLEIAWWPTYALNHNLQVRIKTNNGKTTTNFDPSKLIKVNQTLIQLEVFKAVELFYSTVVTDNANVNEKDKENYKFAKQRFTDEWQNAIMLSAFYDNDSDLVITKDEENEVDEAYYDSDRRYF